MQYRGEPFRHDRTAEPASNNNDVGVFQHSFYSLRSINLFYSFEKSAFLTYNIILEKMSVGAWE
jgi:hypothetical protein